MGPNEQAMMQALAAGSGASAPGGGAPVPAGAPPAGDPTQQAMEFLASKGINGPEDAQMVMEAIQVVMASGGAGTPPGGAPPVA